VAITGLQSGETILAIDFRPATGQLYGIGSSSRLYVINQNTGAARALTTESFRPGLAGNQVAAFDFNPTVDRIRLVTSTGQNLRLNPETGTVANTDGSINGATGATITGAAYTNNVAGASTTVLYDLDPASDRLFRQDPPNEGTLVAVGNLNLNISGDGGFDIDARTGTALGLYSVNGNPTLFAVDLSTGAARSLAQYAATTGYTGLAIPTRPVAYALTYQESPRDNQVFSTFYIFDPTNNVEPLLTRSVTGLKVAEAILGMDFRPATGQIYAVTNLSGLYTLNTATGAATFVANLSIPLETDGFGVGFDFNPVADRIRLVTRSGQNLRINPADGVAIADGRLNPGTPFALSAAYDNNFAGATTTNLYVIGTDSGLDNSKLYRQSPPNDGTLALIGNTGFASGFDIGGTTNTGYLFSAGGGQSGSLISTVDLSTGAVTTTRTGSGARGLGGAFTVGLGF
jgi:hypothetical protein